MPRFARLIVFSGLVLAGFPHATAAVTLRDVVELTRAGLDDEVIVALLEVDRTIFGLDAQQLIELRQSGVSERVLLALLRNGRDELSQAAADPVVNPQSASTTEDREPQVIVIDHHETPGPVAVPYYVPYPVYLSTPVRSRPHVARPPDRTGAGRYTGFGPRPGPVRSSSDPALRGGGFGRFPQDPVRPRQ